MKSPKVIHYINFGIFPAGASFCVGFTYDEIIKQFIKDGANEWATAIGGDKRLIDNGGYKALHRTLFDTKINSERSYFFIILSERFGFTPYEYCKLAHEVLHICQFFLPDVLDRNKEHEAEAYLHTHIMKECLKILGAKL